MSLLMIVNIDGDPNYDDDDDHPLDIDVILFTEEVQSKSEFHSVHTCIPISVNFVKHVSQILNHGDNDDDVDDAFSNMCIKLKSHFKIFNIFSFQYEEKYPSFSQWIYSQFQQTKNPNNLQIKNENE